jgi:hypothetical protein
VAWTLALPLIIPFFILVLRRKRALKTSPFVGNILSRIYHRRGCEYERKMGMFRKYPLWSASAAERQNFRPCRWCGS